MDYRHFDLPASLSFYLEQFRRVRRAPWKGGWAPQKPVLLLTLLDLLDSGAVRANRFPMDAPLFAAFRRNWRMLVPEDGYSPAKLLRPLFHLQGDGFWRLVDDRGGSPAGYIGSKSALQAQIRYGRLDDRLFAVLERPEFRQLARLFLLNTFFPERQADYGRLHPNPLFDQLTDYEAEVLLEQPVRYGRRSYQFEGFLRSLAFRRRVLEQYEYTCCISGFHVHIHVPMVEAAHIIPHAETGEDLITNGLTLCPNLHTAFDYGLIALTDDYQVLLRPGLQEGNSPYNLSQLKGRRIRLPADTRFHPAPERLRDHRRRHGFS